MTKHASKVEASEPDPMPVRDIEDGENVCHDAVFGEVTDHGPNYRGLGWMGTVVVMMKVQIGLGVLSLPQVFDTVGMIPGALLLCTIAAIATWTSYMVGAFKLRHPEVYSMDDAGQIMFGRVGREVLGLALAIWMIFVAGSGMLGVSIALNAISAHATCTAVFVVVAAIIGMLLASIRTLERISWLAWAGLASIFTSIFIVTVAVGIQDRPSSAPQEGPWSSDYKLFRNPTFAEAAASLATIVFSCAATPAYFAVAAEMKDPRMYTRSLVLAQIGSTSIYLAIALVVYYFCGSYVSSPALGSAGNLIKRISYGIALPGLLVTTALFIHLPAKYFFVRILRGSSHLTSNSLKHWTTWLSCTFGAAVIAYVIGSGIPVFGGLTSLIGALLGTFLAYHPAGCMWLYDNWSEKHRSWKWVVLASWSIFLLVGGTFLTVAGTYGAISGIIDSLKSSTQPAPWTCADNSA